MFFLSENRQALMHRLEMKGLEKSAIPGFIWCLKSCLVNNPGIDQLQANRRLQSLGWDDFNLDYHTMQLAIANFESE